MRTLFAFLALLPAAAQPPRLANARLETHSAAAGLEKEMRALIAAATGPSWIGYAVPALPGDHNSCCWSNGSQCACGLESKRDAVQQPAQAGAVKLEGSRELLVLYRIDQHALDKIRTFSGDCALDAGGLPFHWLTEVRPADSVALLSSYATGPDRLAESAVSAVALHAGAEADRAMENFLAAGRPDRVREQAVFWLGAARGHPGYDRLARLMREEPSAHLRKKAVFALSISKEPPAVDAMIDAAKRDADPGVRGEALFWLAQKAGKKAEAAISEAIERDPETEVKKRAVFALSQLPTGEGVPLLIQVARNNRNPAVRKQAMFWLGQSRDPRALTFFEDVLKH